MAALDACCVVHTSFNYTGSPATVQWLQLCRVAAYERWFFHEIELFVYCTAGCWKDREATYGRDPSSPRSAAVARRCISCVRRTIPTGTRRLRKPIATAFQEKSSRPSRASLPTPANAFFTSRRSARHCL